MKKIIWIVGGIAVLIAIILIGLRLFIGGGEDAWIKDNRGVWIKHGNPFSTPDYVTEQQDAIDCVNELYNKARDEGMNFSSQCLGSCGDYAVDVVRVPRTSDDNKPENQCTDFREGKIKHFIELDKNGAIVRVV